MRKFRLYPVEQRWWSFADYEGLLSITERFRPRTVLEFGPGSSTLALVEGGAGRVWSCEDDSGWLNIYAGRFVKHPVTLLHYAWSDPIVVRAAPSRFDMAFIDGPRDTTRRPPVIRYCLERCDVVVCPAEREMDRSYLRPHIEELAAAHDRALEWVPTGPWTHAMGVMTRR